MGGDWRSNGYDCNWTPFWGISPQVIWQRTSISGTGFRFTSMPKSGGAKAGLKGSWYGLIPILNTAAFTGYNWMRKHSPFWGKTQGLSLYSIRRTFGKHNRFLI